MKDVGYGSNYVDYMRTRKEFKELDGYLFRYDAPDNWVYLVNAKPFGNCGSVCIGSVDPCTPGPNIPKYEKMVFSNKNLKNGIEDLEKLIKIICEI